MLTFKNIKNSIIDDYNFRKKIINEMGIFSYIINQKGYVLIIVLIVTTLLITLSTDFIIASQTNIGYTRKFNEKLKASYLAKSGLELGKFILEADKSGIASSFLPGINSDKEIDSYQDIWAKDFPEIPIEEGSLKLSISDENSKINLSILANEFSDKTLYYGITQRFFINMGLSPDFADIIIDWVDIDDTPFPYGAESGDYYLSLDKPYSAKNSAMDSIDEMLLLKKMTPEIYYGLGSGNTGMEENLVDHNKGDVSFDLKKAMDMANKKKDETDSKNPQETGKKKDYLKSKNISGVSIGKEKSRRLSDYLRVYGKREIFEDQMNKININTAPYRVISALTDKMTDAVVTEIISRRINSPFKSVDEIKDLIDDASFEILKKYIITVKSSIFKITSTSKIRDSVVKITAFYNRELSTILYWSEE